MDRTKLKTIRQATEVFITELEYFSGNSAKGVSAFI